MKTLSGYNGFIFDTSSNITLEMDLKRRDLTINAIAENIHGQLIDPFHGIEDIQNKVLRHVSPSFADDPVRILRLSRFLAKFFYRGFYIAEETKSIITIMVQNNITKELTSELIWKEMQKSLGEKNPEKFFEVLKECGALGNIIPFLNIDELDIERLKRTSELTQDPVIRFVALFYEKIKKTYYLDQKIEEKIKLLCKKLNAPYDFSQQMVLFSKYFHEITSKKISSQMLYNFFNDINLFNNSQIKIFDCDLLKNIKLFGQFLETCQIITNLKDLNLDLTWLEKCAKKVKSYDSQELYVQGLKGKQLRDKLKENRIKIIENFLVKNVKNKLLLTSKETNKTKGQNFEIFL